MRCNMQIPFGLLVPGLLAFGLCAALGGASASDGERPREPAFQGHAAEIQMRTPEAERRRRALYFDRMDAEIGEPGLPCDHLVRRRPDAIAGVGHVVLVASRDPHRVVRVWFAPGAAASAEAATAQALRLAAPHLENHGGDIVDQATFAWCR